MLALELLSWWYSQGWLGRWRSIGEYSTRTIRFFSIQILLTTLFEPWRRIVSYPGSGLDNLIRAKVDNLFSRLVGFTVRILVLLLASIIIITVLVAGVALLIVWPFLPFGLVFLLVKGVL